MTIEWKYDELTNTYDAQMDPSWSLSESPHDAQPITVENITPDDKQKQHGDALILRNVLSQSECELLIAKTEQLGYKEVPVEYRSNTRVIINDLILSELISSRIQPFIPQVQKNGTWKYYGLNEHFRFCRYTPGQHFNAHRDKHFSRGDNDRSFYTFMIYLNNVENGGTTRFLESGTKRVVSTVKPEAGMALVFPHPLYHDGERLEDGLKYLCRSDLMFHKQ
jgi:prolyl 4-hydroxylase